VRDRGVLQKFGECGARPGGASAVSLLLVTNGDAGVLDEGRYAERLALAARACGLGSVIATLRNEGPNEAKKLLGIPEDERAVVIVTIGHTHREARKALPKQGPAARKPWSSSPTGTAFSAWALELGLPGRLVGCERAAVQG
jgi:Nitroreductase family